MPAPNSPHLPRVNHRKPPGQKDRLPTLPGPWGDAPWVFQLRPERETALLCAEVYRRGDQWRLRALGDGYADGLAGLARDYGVEVA